MARGQYLTDHLAICGDCHTPRNRLGVRQTQLYLAGVAKGPRGELVPNITSDPETGVGGWDEDDVVALLESGLKPNFDNVQGLMAEIVDGIGGGPGLGRAPAGDLRAIASYVKKVPAVVHRVESSGATGARD
jgi:mono/diheme cytochrome c family protein